MFLCSCFVDAETTNNVIQQTLLIVNFIMCCYIFKEVDHCETAV